MRFLLDEVHVESVPGFGGPQHVFPPQHQDVEGLALKLQHHCQQLQQHIQVCHLHHPLVSATLIFCG